jgi:hypothetical protein
MEETGPSDHAATEIRAEKLARRALWSALSGLIGVFLMSICVSVAEPRPQQRFFRILLGVNSLHLICYTLVVVGAVGSFAATVLGASSVRRANTINRSLAAAGLIFGILGLCGIAYLGLTRSPLVPYLFALF